MKSNPVKKLEDKLEIETRWMQSTIFQVLRKRKPQQTNEMGGVNAKVLAALPELPFMLRFPFLRSEIKICSIITNYEQEIAKLQQRMAETSLKMVPDSGGSIWVTGYGSPILTCTFS